MSCLFDAQPLREWQAYIDCKKTIVDFLEQLPLFKQLASKAIRQRHWDEVMKITGNDSTQPHYHAFDMMHSFLPHPAP